MPNLIVYEKQAGGPLIWVNLSAESCATESIQNLALSIVPEGRAYLITSNTYPIDSYFVDAYRIIGEALSIDLDAARQMHLDKLKTLRDIKYAELGVPLGFIDSFKANLSASEQGQITDLQDVDTYDLSSHTDASTLRDDIPTILTS